MNKRLIAFFALMMTCMFGCILSVYTVSQGEGLAQAAELQSSYKLTVTTTRGTIYDCSLNPLTGTEQETVAAIAPSVDTAAALNRILSADQMQQIYNRLTQGTPFLMNFSQSISEKGIRTFLIDKRYSSEAKGVHILGYLDGNGQGAAGVEKAFNEQLSANQGKLTVSYQVDAMNRVLAGEDVKVEDTTYLGKSGVVLTLNEKIQQIAEKAADDFLDKGAIVVTEVPSCKIRAMVSRPTYSQDDVAASLNAEGSPLLNRALAAYSVGSVFKVCAASTALEYGISPDLQYTCTGGIDVDGAIFHCYNSESHGTETMSDAIAHSCNSYFIWLMQQVPPAQFLLMAQNMGFGQSLEIAPGITSAAGTLPSLTSLKIPRALANFSIGQGDFTATPLQVGAMVNAIASGGVYTQPYLYQGLVDYNLNYTEKAAAQKSVRIVSENTAKEIREFMQQSVEVGTSRKAKPEQGGAGAKTATAQTGQTDENGEDEVNSWISGFFPYDDPQYVITVFAEGGDGGGTTCGPVFKQIADAINSLS